jgi:hypothetical protein
MSRCWLLDPTDRLSDRSGGTPEMQEVKGRFWSTQTVRGVVGCKVDVRYAPMLPL